MGPPASLAIYLEPECSASMGLHLEQGARSPQTMNRIGMALRSLCCTAAAVVIALIATAHAREARTGSLTYTIERGPLTVQWWSRFTSEQVATLEVLNRADAQFLSRLDAVVVPAQWQEDVLRYSPFPGTYEWAASMPQLIVVDQPSQAFAAYESGVLVRWGPISSGRERMPTPAGLFHLTWRSPGRHSTVDPAWYMPWYFNFENDRGLSFHQYALPGLPASHACIRLLERDARWLYDWGETWTLDERGWAVLDPGTPVLIAGCYNFTRPPPWRSQGWLSSGIALPDPPQTDRTSCAE